LCRPAEERGTQCQSPTPTSQGSSTKRKKNCKNHTKAAPRGKDGDEGAGGGGGESGSTLGTTQQAVSVRG